MLAEGAIILLALVVHQLTYLAYLLVLAVLLFAGASLITRRSVADMAMDDFKKVDPVDVRTGWANLGVALDLAFTVMGPISFAGALLAPSGALLANAAGHGPVNTVIGIVASLAPSAVWMAAHHLATRPRRRKRVLAPVPTTN
jgi:hypothetical protein